MGERPVELPRGIGLWGGIAIIVGTTIGSGIFRTPGSIAQQVSDPRVVLALWTLFGLVSLCGALVVTELSSMMPRTGGVYVFLRAAYGDASAFVFGWLYLLVAGPAAIGALSTFALELLAQFFPGTLDPDGLPARAVAAGLVVALTAANLAGLRWGTALQYAFTVIKVGTLLAVMLLAFGSMKGDAAHFAGSGTVGAAAVAGVMASILFTYDGWVQVSLVAGEIHAAERRMKAIIVGGMLTIIALYLGANLAYVYMFAHPEIAGERVIAAKLVGAVVGPWGADAVKLGILASVAGALNGNIIARPRVTVALAADGLTFKPLGRLPVAICVQSAVAVALIFTLKSFDTLIEYFVATESLSLLGAVAALFVLRRKMADAERPFRVPLYPWTPLFFLVGMTAGLVALSWGEARQGKWHTLGGTAIVLAGFPIYFLWRRTLRRPTSAGPFA